MNATTWIECLGLKPHPEGGFFREVYRSAETIPGAALPPRFLEERQIATSIYYLLERGDFSAFHRIRSDEIWHFYAGGPLDLHLVTGAQHTTISLGLDPSGGMFPQAVVPHGVWFAAEPRSGAAFSLVGCTVSPGFDFRDFEFGTEESVLGALRPAPSHLSRLFRTTGSTTR